MKVGQNKSIEGMISREQKIKERIQQIYVQKLKKKRGIPTSREKISSCHVKTFYIVSGKKLYKIKEI